MFNVVFLVVSHTYTFAVNFLVRFFVESSYSLSTKCV